MSNSRQEVRSQTAARLLALLDGLEFQLDDEGSERGSARATDGVAGDPEVQREARTRVLRALGLSTGAAGAGEAVEGDAPEELERQFEAILAANWLVVPAFEELPVLTRRSGFTLPTLDLYVPGLVDVGYTAEVEAEVDVNVAAETATITFLLTRSDNWTPSRRLRLHLTTESGAQTPTATVSRRGVAVLEDVPLRFVSDQPFRLWWTSST
jgi:hypothetical protein